MHVSPATRPAVDIPSGFYATSDLYGWTRVLWLFSVLGAEVALLPIVAGAGASWAYVLLLPLLGASAYKLTIVLHECSHKTLFRTGAFNRCVGLAAGAILATEFGNYARQHWTHHRHCGTHDDGEGADYLTLIGASRLRLVLHLVKPLTGVTYLEMIRARLLGRNRLPRRPFGWAQWNLALVVVAHLIIAFVATRAGEYPWLAFVFPLSGATLGLFFSRTRAFCEHVSIVREDGACFARSHRPNAFDRLFFYTLNMNLHVEHHWYPQIPGRNLPRLGVLLNELGYLSPEMTSSSIARTLVRCFLAAGRSRRSVGPGEIVVS